MALLPTFPRIGEVAFTPQDAVLETPVVYPSTWFADHPNAKPPVPVTPGITLPQAYHQLCNMGNQWSDVIVSSFMVRYMENSPFFRHTPTEAWNSFGRQLAVANQPCTPVNLLAVTNQGPPFNLQQGAALAGGGEDDHRNTFFALLTLFRKTLTREARAEYGVTIQTRLETFFTASKFQINQDVYATWNVFMSSQYLTPGYRAIICAIDMFFFKYSTAEYSSMRIATLSSRYRGCTAYTSFGAMAKSLGMTSAQLAKFVYTEAVAKEVYAICKEDEGTDDLYGYFPYQLDMGITPKSVYSLTNNPTLYLWIHTIGCIMAHSRSINAVLPSNLIDQGGTIASAAIVAYRLAGTGDFYMMLVNPLDQQAYLAAYEPLRQRQEEAERRAALIDLEDEEGGQVEAPVRQDVLPRPRDQTERQAQAIFLELYQNNGLTDEIRNRLHRKFRTMDAPRERTIGNMLRNYFA